MSSDIEKKEQSLAIIKDSGKEDDDVKKQEVETTSLASVRDVFSFARTPKIKLCMFASFCCATVSGAVLPAVAFYFASAFEDLAGSTDENSFMTNVRELAYVFMILGFIAFSFMTAQTMLIETSAQEMTTIMKTEWFKALLRQDVAYYDLMDVTGEATILTINGNKYKKGVGRKLAEAWQFSITFVGAFVYAFWASWQVSLMVCAICPFIVASTKFLVDINTTQSARANASYAKAGSIVTTSIQSIRTILSLNAVETVIELFKEATSEAYEGSVNKLALIGMANGFCLDSMMLAYVIVTTYGSYIIYSDVEDNGCDPSGSVIGKDKCNPSGNDVFGALFGISFGAAVIPQISVAIESFLGARVACYPAITVMKRTIENTTEAANGDKMMKKGESTSEGADQITKPRGNVVLPEYKIDSSSEEGMKPAEINGEIEFHNVEFSYPARPKERVLRDFSFKAAAGKTVALVGASGSGKSTVVQLLERFYDPISGSITLDGVDIKEINIKWLRQRISLVSQEPKLFSGTIRENIAVTASDVSNEWVEEAAKKANAYDFIRSFPNGFDTEVGDLGVQLSGGQRQRIAIARALFRRPRILLLDEATSALDSESEKVVQKALDSIMSSENMTTIVIAHRLSTIKNADVIAVVNEGKVVEVGTHDDLLSKRGKYFDLIEAQKMKTSPEAPEALNQNNGKDESHQSSRQSSVIEDSDAVDDVDDASTKAVIRFEDVHFEYPTRRDTPIFQGLNLTVKQGETLALVGPSGCGKSSIVQLIECFYRPTQGRVLYNGVDMKDLNVRWLRTQLGLVSQEPILFDTTIRENIRYGMQGVSDDQVIEAAKQANAHSFITDFAEGYETLVGQGSTLVSGGQKQRIAIARALVRKPRVLLLDEATSALDSESEKIVQNALDSIMFDKDQTCIVIAHRLSTIQNADRIAVIAEGKVREIGTHEELMSNPNGRYRRLQMLQSLSSSDQVEDNILDADTKENTDKAKQIKVVVQKEDVKDMEEEIEKKAAVLNMKRARLLGSGDSFYYVVGAIGALLAGFTYPAWGIAFAFMVEVLYTRVEVCPNPDYGLSSGADCELYWDSTAEDMREKSFNVFYGYLGILVSGLSGLTILFWAFGIAAERMHKRVRDGAFSSLLRQEVAWFDLHSPGTLASRLSDDAALLHAFAGEPIRTLVINVSSVVVGVAISFIYMWPFALMVLAITPAMGFGAEMEMRTYLGEDEGDDDEIDQNSPGGIVIEALANIRTIASLTLEQKKAIQYNLALRTEDPHPIKNNFIKGSATGLGQFCQMWGFAMMFWWGGWLLNEYPDSFTYREFLISMFASFFGLYGISLAAQGAVNRDKAKSAANRIFEIIDRESLIDPLTDTGKKDV